MKIYVTIEKIILQNVFVFLFVFIGGVFGQTKKTYFEMKSNTIAIEAENAFGYGGWITASEATASGGRALIFPQSDTLTFAVFSDTYVDLDNPDANFGSEPYLLVEGKGGLKRGFFITPWWDGRFEAFRRAAFLKFDISGVQRPIVEAKVFLYCESSGIGGGIYSLDPMIDDLDWVETQATWNNRPSKHYDGNTFQEFLDYTVSAGQWVEFDVTESMYEKQDGVYSFGIVMQQNQPTLWSSKEGTHPSYLWIRTKKQGFQIVGSCYYYSNNSPIPNIKLEASGDFSRSQYSNSEGNYLFEDINSGASCVIIPNKESDTEVGPYDITTFDAALTAQRAVGLRSLNTDQETAADVSKDGNISTYDAALIARYAVGLPKLSDSYAGDWVFMPENRTYSNLLNDKSGQDFKGILLGNVHGGWQAQSYERRLLAKSLQMNDYVLNPKEEFDFPIRFPGGENVISFDLELAYDKTMLEFKGIKRTGLGAAAEIFYNDNHGVFRLGAYQLVPFDVKGELFSVKFKVLEGPVKTSFIKVNKFLLNKDVVFRGKSTVQIAGGSSLPTAYHLYQCYPNPFSQRQSQRSSLRIEFDVPQKTLINMIIYNQAGQLVRRLVDEERGAGHYAVLWDGRNEAGQIVSSGIYLYQLKAKGFRGLKRIVFLR
ncbi:MAG: DNRLRE domain-containing protein [Calditrichaeota bacterium]|nr:DNRLRE domain-containing protein [Calditrichota bacterium]